MQCASYRDYAVFNARNGEIREVWFDPSENSECLVGCTMFYTRSARVNPHKHGHSEKATRPPFDVTFTLYRGSNLSNLPSFLLSITQYGSRHSYVSTYIGLNQFGWSEAWFESPTINSDSRSPRKVSNLTPDKRFQGKGRVVNNNVDVINVKEWIGIRHVLWDS